MSPLSYCPFLGGPTCRCPPGLPGTGAVPTCGPGARQGEPGCCGAGGDLPADVSVPSLSAARRVRTSPRDVASSSLHFFFFSPQAELALVGVQGQC